MAFRKTHDNDANALTILTIFAALGMVITTGLPSLLF